MQHYLTHALFLVAFGGVAATSSADVRPNILWIIADDLGPELGCYGAEHVSTPNIDQLAREGRRFTHAFATAPVCSSSRTALITGMYQTSIGGQHHRTWKLPTLPDGVEPVTETFRRAGFFVCNMRPTGVKGKAKVDWNFVHDESAFDGNDWNKRAEGQPFFGQVQIKEPHRAFVKDDHPTRAAELTLPPIYPDHPITRADWANYLKSVEVLDERVGDVLKRLDDEGLTDNTVVFFFGDHGRPHVWGKQWLYDGGLHVPLIIRWPGRLDPGEVDGRLVSLIDVAPTSLRAAGLDVPIAMQGVDIFASGFVGREYIFAARDRCGDAVDRIRCVRTKRFKFIRNFEPQRPYTQMSGYKKLQYPVLTLLHVLHARGELTPAQARYMTPRRPEEELYDLTRDPHETTNLVDDASQAAVLNDLRQQLAEWAITTGDRGDQPEGDAEFMANIMAEKRRYYERAMQRRGLDPNLSDEEYLDWWAGELGVTLPE